MFFKVGQYPLATRIDGSRLGGAIYITWETNILFHDLIWKNKGNDLWYFNMYVLVIFKKIYVFGFKKKAYFTLRSIQCIPKKETFNQIVFWEDINWSLPLGFNNNIF